MRKADEMVQEVVCSETGKPMSKIPQWMAGIKVKFVSDEARQKHPTPSGILDIEPERKGRGDLDDLDVKDLGEADESPDAAEYDDLNEEEAGGDYE